MPYEALWGLEFPWGWGRGWGTSGLLAEGAGLGEAQVGQEAGRVHPEVAYMVAATQVTDCQQESVCKSGLDSPALWLAFDFSWVAVCLAGGEVGQQLSGFAALLQGQDMQSLVPAWGVCARRESWDGSKPTHVSAMHRPCKIPDAGCRVQGERTVPWLSPCGPHEHLSGC